MEMGGVFSGGCLGGIFISSSQKKGFLLRCIFKSLGIAGCIETQDGAARPGPDPPHFYSIPSTLIVR